MKSNIVALVILAALIVAFCAVYIRRAGDHFRAQVAAWRARSTYQAMVTDCAMQYREAIDLHYSARDARALVRQHIRYTYQGISPSERNHVMRAAIQRAKDITIDARPLKDINARPSYA